MPHESITVTADGPACIIRLNRPARRNAVSLQRMKELAEAARTAEAEAAVRSIIITGGDAFFSSGADLTEAVEVTGVEGCRDYFRNWHALTRTLENLGKPVIAAIEGYCFTGGLELALACDLRVAG
ncbi:MAG TPA: enoyl-CoA hydratase, partial [Rhodospirillaceae bacterium]|nr:enoyl-CoA hydratase [Rhodospirillaceae bacterium]